MKCPRCQNNLIIGLPDCVNCSQNIASAQPVQCKNFVFASAAIFCFLGIIGPVDGFEGFLKAIGIGALGGLVWGSVIWFFYMLFRRNIHR